MKPYRVYGKSGAGSLVVEYLLTIAGVEYELICLDKEARDGEPYRRIAPHGLIPALETPEGEALCESLAITIYLLEKHPETGMIAPPGHPKRLQCLQWLSILSTSLYNANLRCYYPEKFGPADAVCAQGMADRQAVYDLIEGNLERRQATYLAGDAMSAADLYLYMLMQWDDERQAELATRPRLSRIIEDVGALPQIMDVMARQP